MPAEIKKLLDIWFGNNQAKCETFELFQSKIQEIDKKLNDYSRLKNVWKGR